MTIQHDPNQPHSHQQPSHQPPPPPGHPPQFAPQPQFVPVKKKSKAPLILGIIGIVLFVVIGGCAALIAAAGSGVNKAVEDFESSVSAAQQSIEQAAPPAAPGEQPTAPAEQQAAPAAAIGAPVRDGKFEFTVTEIEDGPTRIGNEYFGEDAQGKFVLVHVTVQNIGDEAQYFSDSVQKLFDAQGREFSADSAAAIYLEQGSQSFLNEINPGNKVQGILVFDIPVDVTPTSIELHDSMFSSGVTVALG